MARRRFFVDRIHNQRAELAGEEAHHLTRVLRVERGQVYEISDNAGVWLAEVAEARKDRVLFAVGEAVPLSPPPLHLTLLVSLIKFDHFEWILEKGAELGVELFLPVVASRSEKGLDRAAVKRIARWKRILLEASQQCRRDRLPEIRPPVTFGEALSTGTGRRFRLEEQSGAAPLLSCVPAQRSREDCAALLVGPEGGWTDDEREQAGAAGWRPVSVGTGILRAETAALAATAILAAAWQAGETGSTSEAGPA